MVLDDERRKIGLFGLRPFNELGHVKRLAHHRLTALQELARMADVVRPAVEVHKLLFDQIHETLVRADPFDWTAEVVS